MTKYPFVVTVFRFPGTNRPAIQQYNFEVIGQAHTRLCEADKLDRAVYGAAMSVTLKEIIFRTRVPLRRD